MNKKSLLFFVLLFLISIVTYSSLDFVQGIDACAVPYVRVGCINWSAGNITNHSQLNELDYASSGHTGFKSDSAYDSNYSTNDPVYRSFANNYSNFTFIYTYAVNDTDYNASGLIRDWSYLGGGVSWANVVNGTVLLTSSWETNYTANNDKWLNTTNLTYDAYNSTGLIKDWNATGYIIDWSYLGGGLTWAEVVNGTLFTTALYNTNYTANDPVYRSFANNYSTFLTHIDWAKVVNGTMLSQADYNTNYSTLMLQATWNTNYTANNDKWLNTTNITYHGYNSTGLIQDWWIPIMNGTLYTQAEFDTNYSTLMLQSTWNTNYTANNDKWLNTTNITYHNYNSTGLIQDWWIPIMNGTLYTQAEFDTNYTTLMLQATFNTNYTTNDPVYRNTTNLSYVLKAGDTMSGNLTMGNNYVTNGTGGAYIYHNGTGWVIKG